MSSIVDKFKDDCVQVFSLEGKPAVELLASNPLAGFCLANNHRFHPPINTFPTTTARNLMGKPQREILAWLGFRPATEAVAKIGRKVVPESLTLERSLQLRRILVEDNTREMLAHLRCINGGVIDLVSSPQLRSATTPRLLHAVAECADEVERAETATLLRDTLKMRSMLRRKDPLRPFASRHRVLEAHDELVSELNSRGIRAFSRRSFPPPPFPAWDKPGEKIIPIRSAEALQALGREQHNCVSSYRDKILKGSVFVYRVEVQGQVCALSLVPDGKGGHRIGEFQSSCNQPPSELARFVVRRWLGRDHSPCLPLGAGPSRVDRSLPPPPFAGATLKDGAQVSPVRDYGSLLELVGNPTAADFACDSGRRKHEHYYRLTTADGQHLVTMRRHSSGYRLQSIRRADGAAVRGELLVAVSDWLGKVQGRYR